MILGIDLGTTNSACGVFDEQDGVMLIPNRLGKILTPSVVGLSDDGELLVGQVARERLITHSALTMANIKRLIGTQHEVRLGKKNYSAVELSAMILRHLKEDAEAHLKTEVNEAVISVPAYFNDNQRHATKAAGELAGLTVRRLINEPTAAALAYGLQDQEEGTFMVLDMGGGTFDVSILEYFDGVMEVHASAGDNFLGGEDVVDAMSVRLLTDLGLEDSVLSEQEAQQLRLKLETAKRQISTVDRWQQTIVLAGESREFSIDEQWMHQVTAPLMIRAQRPVEQALSDAQIHPDQIRDIILVGGATRMKVFRSMVSRLFKRLPSSHLDPDQVVAMGACVQAGLTARSAALDDVVLTDVCPYTLGVEVARSVNDTGYFMPIIERNVVVPISVAHSVATLQDGQKLIRVNVYQGESYRVDKNVFLGMMEVSIPKKPAGEEQIDIRFSYDMNGLLEVDVTVLSTGKTLNHVIDQTPGALSDEDRRRSAKRLAELKSYPREHEENRVLLARGERMYASALGDRRHHIGELMAQFEQVLSRQNPQEISRARQQLSELLKALDDEHWFD